MRLKISTVRRPYYHPSEFTFGSLTHNIYVHTNIKIFLTAESFLAPAQTSSEFYIDTCAFAFLNFDIEEYSVCYLNFVRSFLPPFSCSSTVDVTFPI